jgi:DNA polymerase
MRTCWLDTETRSATPISHGTDNYTANAECMIVTWCVDAGPVKLWDRTAHPQMPDDLHELLHNPDVVLIAHNAKFDRAVIRCSLGIDTAISRWRCTMAQAYSHGLPGSLEALGVVLGLSEAECKMHDGKPLIQLFCTPADYKGPGEAARWFTRTTHPTEWATFCAYAVQDTEALRTIDRKLPTHNYKGENLRLWWLDQIINERGFGFDDVLAIAARKALSGAKATHDAQTTRVTDGAATAATQRAKLLKWFETSGFPMPDMKAATINEYLESDNLDPVIRFMLELRLEASKSSGSKYNRGLILMGKDARMRHAIQFGGAGRTGRFAGRGFQPHNMPRPKAKFPQIVQEIQALKGGNLDLLSTRGVNTVCADMLRSAIITASGNTLTVADWSNIESRILAWIANELWKLTAYLEKDAGRGADLYKLLFHNFFGTPLDQIDDNQRQSGKVSDLAFGFGGGVGALVTMAAGYGMDLDALPPMVLPNAKPEMLKKAHKAWRRAFLKNEDYGLEPATYIACDVLKQVYREASASINSLRHSVDDATKTAVKSPGTVFEVAKCRIWSTGSWLIIELPSGRRLLYSNPKIEQTTDTDPETGKVQVRESISYMTARGKQWRRERAWSGLFIENIVQAIANDVMRAALLAVHDWTRKQPAIAAYLNTLPASRRTAIVLHVHDEVVLELPPGMITLEKLIALMTKELAAANPWMKGLPLAAEGWIGPRYHK